MIFVETPPLPMYVALSIEDDTVVVPLYGDLETSSFESRYSRTRLIAKQVPIYGDTPYKGTVPIQGDPPCTGTDQPCGERKTLFSVNFEVWSCDRKFYCVPRSCICSRA